jgi:hypothetical protein
MIARYSNFSLGWSWLGAILGGLTYLLLNLVLETYFPDHWAGSPTTFLGISYAGWSRLLWVPYVLLLVGLAGVYARLSGSLGRMGKVGLVLALTGFFLEILGNLIEFWIVGVLLVPLLGEFRTGSSGSQVGYAISGYGTIFIMAGLLLLGIASLRSTLPVRWRLLLFSIGFIYISGLFFYFFGLLTVHAIPFGLSWMLLGYIIWSEDSTERLTC